MRKKILILVGVILVIMTVFALFYTKKISPTKVMITLSGDIPKEYTISTGRASYKGTGATSTIEEKDVTDMLITISADGYITYSQLQKLEPSKTNNILIKLQKIGSVESAVLDRYTYPGGQTTSFGTARLIKYKTFENETWVAGAIGTEGNSDGEIIVLRKVNANWVTVISGTVISAKDLQRENAPKDLIEYVRTL